MDNESSQQPQPPTPAQQYRFAFIGDGTSYAVVFFKTLLLTLVTLFLYRPWAKTERRKYIIGHCSFNNERFSFHGTGREIFKAYCVLGLSFVAFLLIASSVGETTGQAIITLLYLVIFFVGVPYVTIAILRYLLTRSTWRGIRLGMAAVHWDYVICWIKGIFLVPLTFGIYYPFWTNELVRISVNAIKFGNISFRYTGSGSDLLGIFLKHFFTMMGIVAVLGIIMSFAGRNQNLTLVFLCMILIMICYMGVIASYTAATLGYRLDKTWMGSPTHGAARGKLTLSAIDVVRIQFVTTLMIVFTFGLALPWAITYLLSNVLSRVEFHGHIDMARVTQGTEEGSALADGTADALDLGGSLGI